MKQIHIDRLLKLADHLEYGQLGHEVFDFNNYNNNYNVSRGGRAHFKPSCGYAGCAIGECPVVFPREWRYDESGWPCMPGKKLLDSIMEFFCIGDDALEHLFIPNSQHARYGGSFLDGDATRDQVAANIRDFAAKKLSSVEKD